VAYSRVIRGAFVPCYGGELRVCYGSGLMVAEAASIVVVFGGLADEDYESQDNY